MSQFEDYVNSVTKSLELPASVVRRIREEALNHLEDERRQCAAAGMGDTDARAAAIERFGRQDVVAGMISAALAERQTHHRRWRRIGLAAATGLLLLAGLVIGAWFNLFDDAVSGSQVNIPDAVRAIVYVGTWIVCVVLLVLIGSRVFRVSGRCLVAAALLVVATFCVSMAFAPSALTRPGAMVNGPEIDFASMWRYFGMRLYLCWAPMVLLVPAVLLLRRTRIVGHWLIAAAATGLLSGALWGIEYANLFYTYPWVTWMKWPKLLSTGLMAVVFVILTGALARALDARFQRTEAASAASAAAETP